MGSIPSLGVANGLVELVKFDYLPTNERVGSLIKFDYLPSDKYEEKRLVKVD